MWCFSMMSRTLVSYSVLRWAATFSTPGMRALLQGWRNEWDALYDLIPFAQFRKSENNHGGLLTLVKFQAQAYNFIKSNTPPWVFFTFLRLYKC